MTEPSPPPIDHYFYHSTVQSRRHRNRVSAYLVHRFSGSVVVARIEPLGLIPSALGERSATLAGLRRNLRVAGPWQRTTSRHHSRVRLAPRDAPQTARRPTESL